MKIAVVGLGYVGLPLSIQFARSCVTVLGIDVDSKKVELLNNGQSYIKHIEHIGDRGVGGIPVSSRRPPISAGSRKSRR